MALNPAFRRGAFTDRELWALPHGLAQEDARFWRNYAALARFALSGRTPPFPDSRVRALEPRMKAHWVQRTLNQLPWQIRELLGEPTPVSIPRPRRPSEYLRPTNRETVYAHPMAEAPRIPAQRVAPTGVPTKPRQQGRPR